jgi:hypothetical protein
MTDQFHADDDAIFCQFALIDSPDAQERPGGWYRVASNKGGWAAAPYEAQYLKVFDVTQR